MLVRQACAASAVVPSVLLPPRFQAHSSANTDQSFHSSGGFHPAMPIIICQLQDMPTMPPIPARPSRSSGDHSRRASREQPPQHLLWMPWDQPESSHRAQPRGANEKPPAHSASEVQQIDREEHPRAYDLCQGSPDEAKVPAEGPHVRMRRQQEGSVFRTRRRPRSRES